MYVVGFRVYSKLISVSIGNRWVKWAGPWRRNFFF